MNPTDYPYNQKSLDIITPISAVITWVCGLLAAHVIDRFNVFVQFSTDHSVKDTKICGV